MYDNNSVRMYMYVVVYYIWNCEIYKVCLIFSKNLIDIVWF